MTREEFWLIVIVAQGFLVCFFEWDVWRIHRERFQERKKWRLAKQKQKVRQDDKMLSLSDKSSETGQGGLQEMFEGGAASSEKES
jgi:hypothetical protein